MAGEFWLSDETWAAIEPLMPKNQPGARRVDNRRVFDRFQAMVRHRNAAALGSWLDDAAAGPLASFANGLRADRSAVAAAFSLPWSNGQTEGHITKLKLAKRQMYGRAKLDLLRARNLSAA